MDGLPVRERDDREQQCDRPGDRDVERDACRSREQQHIEDLVRPVRHRRQCVETEGADRRGLGQAFVLLRGTGQRPSEEGATQYSHPARIITRAPPQLHRVRRGETCAPAARRIASCGSVCSDRSRSGTGRRSSHAGGGNSAGSSRALPWAADDPFPCSPSRRLRGARTRRRRRDTPSPRTCSAFVPRGLPSRPPLTATASTR